MKNELTNAVGLASSCDANGNVTNRGRSEEDALDGNGQRKCLLTLDSFTRKIGL